MEKFNLQNIAENNDLKTPSKFYMEWYKKMVKDGVRDVNELSEESYIKHIIEEGTLEDVDIAFKLANKNTVFRDVFPNLLADLYSKKGDIEKAKDLILQNTVYRHRDPYMSESLRKLFDLHPEVKDEFIEEIKKERPEFYNNLPEDLK